MWKNIDSTQKQKYQEGYMKDMEEYEHKYQKYTASLSPKQKEAITEAKQEQRQSRKRRKMKKIYKEEHKPKRPLGSFLFFVKDLLASEKLKDKKLADVLMVAKDRWGTMTHTDKEKYLKLTAADKSRYQKEMQEWEIKMIKEGKSDIIRKESRVITSKPIHPNKGKGTKSR